MRRSVVLAVILAGGAIAGLAAFAAVPPADLAGGRSSVTTTSTIPAITTTVAPATTTTTVPLSTTTTAGRGGLIIHGVGDVNFDPDYIPAFLTLGYEHAFAGLGGLFLRDDLTVINLECTASDLGTPLPKEFVFRCDREALPVAREAGVDVANLANNHVQDHGTEAMLDARANVRRAGIRVVGVGADLEEATSPALVRIGDWTIAVLGMGGIVPSSAWLATGDRPGMASGDDIEQMTAAVQAASESADLVVVSIHWGWELETAPRDDDRARARAMIEAGADVIFGHHPHRLGELEFIDGKPVFWTLGNFIWPRLSDAGATTAVARVVVAPDGVLEACLIPAFIETSGGPVLQGPAPCGEPTG